MVWFINGKHGGCRGRNIVGCISKKSAPKVLNANRARINGKVLMIFEDTHGLLHACGYPYLGVPGDWGRYGHNTTQIAYLLEEWKRIRRQLAGEECAGKVCIGNSLIGNSLV